MSYADGSVHAWRGRDGSFSTAGSNHRNALLTEAEVRDIKAALARPYDHRPTYRVLANAYGVSKAAIANIACRRTWTHVHIEEER